MLCASNNGIAMPKIWFDKKEWARTEADPWPKLRIVVLSPEKKQWREEIPCLVSFSSSSRRTGTVAAEETRLRGGEDELKVSENAVPERVDEREPGWGGHLRHPRRSLQDRRLRHRQARGRKLSSLRPAHLSELPAD
jgi:hypothetical protein